ncbi:MAG: hypothetical protein ACRDWA_01080 [Acidimicrobiia bacterium]
MSPDDLIGLEVTPRHPLSLEFWNPIRQAEDEIKRGEYVTAEELGCGSPAADLEPTSGVGSRPTTRPVSFPAV